MTELNTLRTADATTAIRIAGSALSSQSETTEAEFRTWFAECASRNHTEVHRIALSDLDRWSIDATTGNITHDSGKFFVVEGLDVHSPGGRVTHWSQPIINQPEIGILGILTQEFDGVLHFLMQGKVEPGNHNGVQLSPTVQATRSNYTRVHQGKSVPYLDYFLDTARHRTLADALQSEQAAWFLQKRNRNMVVEVMDDVEVMPDFCWLTLRQIHQLLREPDLVNMDARTVLSCLPFSRTGLTEQLPQPREEFTAALQRSCDDAAGALHTTDEILSWITDTRTRREIKATRIPLNEVRDWRITKDSITHETGRYFSVIGVDVRAGGREVVRWSQPMFKPWGDALAAFLVRRIDGVLHALVNARMEPGYLDTIELAPTVQCTVDNYLHLPVDERLPFLDDVLRAPEERIRFDAVQSEEGGRFHHAQVRYVVVETDAAAEHDDYRWMPLHQLVDLLRHSHYLNIQARSLVACLHSLFGG